MPIRAKLGEFLAQTRASKRGIRWAFVFILIFLAIHLYVFSSLMTSSPAGVKTGDIIYVVVIAFLAVPALIVLGWLGFSRDGIALVETTARRGLEEARYSRLVKVLLGAVGIAAIPWVAILLGMFFLGQIDLLVRMFEPWVILLLVIISLPISNRYIR